MLALALGRTIAELQASMSQAEFISWVAFYKLFPFDDFHRFQRPAALVASTQVGRLKEHLEWLQPEPVPEGMTDGDINTLRAFGLRK